MKRILFILSIFGFSISIYPQGWIQQNSGVTQHLRDVYFINPETGYAVGGLNTDIAIKTTNGGVNWNLLVVNAGSPLYSVLFVNAETGFMSPNGIRKTTNAGLNWSIVNSLGGYDIFFLSNTEGYICGWSGRILKTINGGNNWITQNSGISNEINSIYFINSQTGFAAAWFATEPQITYRILRTTDSGNLWTIHKQGSSLSTTQKVVTFSDSTTGYFIEGKTILRSSDSGQNWSTILTLPSGYFNAIDFPSPRTGYAAGSNGIIYKSTDFGINWFPLSSGTSTILYSINFADSLTGYAVGQNGLILKTTSGGITPIITINNEIPLYFSLSQNFPNPFNPTTKIKFDIAKYSSVQLKIFDILGNELTSILNQELKPGTYEINWDAFTYSSGVYYYQIIADNFIQTKKMILMK